VIFEYEVTLRGESTRTRVYQEGCPARRCVQNVQGPSISSTCTEGCFFLIVVFFLMPRSYLKQLEKGLKLCDGRASHFTWRVELLAVGVSVVVIICIKS
jgi:hypothetical protein